MDILSGKNCRQFRLQFTLAFIGRAGYLVGRDGMGEKGGMGETVILARYSVHFFIEHENLV